MSCVLVWGLAIIGATPQGKGGELSRLEKRWELYPAAPDVYRESLADLPSLLVQILYNRQLHNVGEARSFLAKGAADDNPFRLTGMNEAVARLRLATACCYWRALVVAGSPELVVAGSPDPATLRGHRAFRGAMRPSVGAVAPGCGTPPGFRRFCRPATQGGAAAPLTLG